ncbi:MAG: hypothetical protein KBD53_11545 [Candidatus Omnitrophica bacterium]|nr:hypothetical protein [Candidatus Omnitrophota bacterium]
MEIKRSGSQTSGRKKVAGEKTFLKKFSQIIKENFDEFLLKKGFELEASSIEEYFAKRVYKRNKQFIRIYANVNPREMAEYWSIILGEGDREWPELDWNSVGLWHFMVELGQKEAEEYSLKNKTTGAFLKQVKAAKNDLKIYGESFLNNNLDLFYRLRSQINKKREPYKIYSPDKTGKYKMAYEPKSAKLKKKFGG